MLPNNSINHNDVAKNRKQGWSIAVIETTTSRLFISLHPKLWLHQLYLTIIFRNIMNLNSPVAII